MPIKRKLSLFVTMIFVFSILLSGFSVSADRSEMDNQNDKPYKAGEIIVKYKDDVQAREMSSFASGKGLRLKKSFEGGGIKVYGLRSGMSVGSAVKSLLRSDLVEYVQPNYIYKSMSDPADDLYNELWGLNNTGQQVFGQAGSSDKDINAPEAWNIIQGREDIVVAVIDQGVYIDHPDLQDSIWVNAGEIPANGKDDDGNGYIDDVNGWDFYHDDATVFDALDGDEHGTHVAGTIAASIDDIGVVGVAPNVKIMPLKFLGPGGLGYTSDAIAAIEYAKNNGADAVNCSWGGDPGKPEDPMLKYYIENSGLLFVFAAGNEGNNNDSLPVYPASSDCENIISVAAVDNQGNIGSFSNFGASSVDVGAPGVAIVSTIPLGLGGTAAVTVTDAVYGYKVFYSSFDIGDFILEEDKTDFAAKAVGDAVMQLNTGDSILLVDDDETDEAGDACSPYLSILNYLGLDNITEVNVTKNADGPSYEDMKDYAAVMWLTGGAYGCLGLNDQNSIIRYLEDNKKFILIGEDSLYGIEDSKLFKDYLKLDDYIEYGINEEVKWKDELFEGRSYGIIENEWRDIILHTNEYVNPVMEYVPKWDVYKYDNGTSMAAPHVSGIAALLLSKNPDLTPAQIKAAIMGTVKPLDSLNGKTVTGGMADAFAALKAVAPEKPSNLNASKSDSSVTLTWSGNKTGDLKEYIIEKKVGSGSYTELSRTTANSYTDSGLAVDTTYRYIVKAIDNWGNISNASNQATVSTSVTPPSSGDSSGGNSGGGGGGGGSYSAGPADTAPTDSVDSIVISRLNSTSNIVDAKATVKNNVESASVSFDSLAKLTKSQKSLIIRGNNVIFEIPSGAFGASGLKYLNIKLEGLDAEKFKDILKSKDAENTFIGSRIFEFTAAVKEDSKSKSVESFNKRITVSIKLDSKDIDKYGRNKLGVYRYDDKAGSWVYAGGSYDSSNGTITFMTDHFSKYAVMSYSKDFHDIEKHWAKDDIDVLVSRHIAEGRSNGFEPDEYITRLELVKMLVKAAMQMPDKNVKLADDGKVPFPDVSAAGEDRLYISASLREGIIKGLDDGTFGPQKPVSREELAAMTARMMELKRDYDIQDTPFKDKESVSAWAAKDAAAVFEKGIITGDPSGNFSGRRSVTRAEAAAIVRRMMESLGLIDMPVAISGKLVINYIEGTHYELEAEDGICVLIADENDRVIKRMLSSMVEKEVKVKGYIQEGFNIYQRGKVLKVISIE